LYRADLTGALVTAASFTSTISFRKEQLYSTASYRAKDLSGIGLAGLDLTGWNFSEQNLNGANLSSLLLFNAFRRKLCERQSHQREF
jgi:uncharacterized protein YjbI with pentapeptide repeats